MSRFTHLILTLLLSATVVPWVASLRLDHRVRSADTKVTPLSWGTGTRTPHPMYFGRVVA